jgi:tetratricopeptide (TPR) repeat protein
MKKVMVVAAAAAVCLVGLWFLARPAYRRHREVQAVARAKDYLAKADYRNASLCARQALQVNPHDLEACRIMAELSERARSPVVLDWRRRVVETEPTIENKLMLASTALRWQPPPYALTAQTLDELRPVATNLPAYHSVSAELALRLRNPAEAILHFEQAGKLEPTNELHQLNLAVLQLQSTNTAVASAARATLDRLRTSGSIGSVALRWLVADSLSREDLAEAEKFSQQLLKDPRSAPDDRLQHLTILQRTKNAGLGEYLAGVQKNSLTNSAEVYGVSAWMISHGLAQDALQWLTNCPAKVRGEQPVPLALVDCYLATKDWSGLESYLEGQKWGELDFLRYAFLSRASGEQSQKLGLDARWRTAVREAGERLGPLTALLSMATTWNRKEAREELLWQIQQRFPKERWTLRELEREYLVAGNTRGLNKVYTTLAGYSPRNFAAENNLVATSLLLKQNLPRAYDLAKQLFAEHPGEAVVASTYAYSLHMQGRTKEGLSAFEEVKPESLETPNVAIYYGVLLAEAGETNKAAKYLEIAKKSDLLPEEKVIVAEAMKRAGAGS